MRVAAIDVGTNSVHLLVADVQPDGAILVVEKAREQVELGRGGMDRGALADDAMERGLAAMVSFSEAIRGLGVEDVRAAATSAVREAKNGSEWTRRVREATGIHVKVISGTEEARLIYLGARNDLDFSKGYALLLDLGGGSAEFILCDSSRPLVKRSLPVGHIRLAERFGAEDPPSEETWRALRQHLREQLSPLRTDIPPARFGSFTGTSGAVRTLARMATLARGEPAPTHDHGLVLERAELKRLIGEFRRLKRPRYTELPGMDMRRRDTLLYAAAMVYETMKILEVERVVTSERSLRDGLIVDWMLTHQPELDLSRTVAWPRMRAVLRTMDRYEVDKPHAERIRDLSLSLFDQLQPIHQLGGDARRMLEFAALLHDVGHHIDGEDHNKHGQYLIAHSRMNGFTAPEIALLGNIVRYHRGGRPKKEHRSFAALTRPQQQTLFWLAGILRVTDALDRSHSQPIDRVEVTIEPDRLLIRGFATELAHLERWAAERRGGMLERMAQRPVTVQVVPAEAAAGPDALRSPTADQLE